MSSQFKTTAVSAIMFLLSIPVFAGVDGKPEISVPAKPPASADSSDAVYARKLQERVVKIVATLDLKDEKQRERVHNVIVAQYRLLNTWHDTNDSHLTELKKTASGPDTEKSAAAKTEIEAIKATLKTVHDNYLAELAKDLSPQLIERVKDGMTVGKVQFTYTGYVQQIPSLTEEQRAKVLELLKEAREEAMDAGSMDEKSDIFNRYKGRINNWLSKQGVEQGKGKKPKAEKKEPAAQ
ncbi:MAG: DUF3826 domain-containing protein [Nibricoccus sp.]